MSTQSPPLLLTTVYGQLEVVDPLAIELILSPPFQRLKDINQYGVVKYIAPTEEYTRFDHSIGVYYLLNKTSVSRPEQIAGLLHDISHTVFSHVGDYVFDNRRAIHDSYQDDIHLWYLKESGIDAILERYNFSIDDINHKNPHFQALDTPLPMLCADRIEYNLQGGFLRSVLSKEDFEQISSELQYKEGKWSLKTLDSALKLGRCSLIMTETLWGAAWEALSYRFAADSLKRAFDIELVTFEEFHFSTDTLVWNKLISSKDPVIENYMEKLAHIHSCFAFTDHGNEDELFRLKFRGLDPYIETESGLHSLRTLDQNYSNDYVRLEAVMKKGWAIKLNV